MIPGCSVADDFDSALGDPNEARLAAALDYRDGQGCPAPTGSKPGVFGKPGAPPNGEGLLVPKSPWHTNRIMRPGE